MFIWETDFKHTSFIVQSSVLLSNDGQGAYTISNNIILMLVGPNSVKKPIRFWFEICHWTSSHFCQCLTDLHLPISIFQWNPNIFRSVFDTIFCDIIPLDLVHRTNSKWFWHLVCARRHFSYEDWEILCQRCGWDTLHHRKWLAFHLCTM